MATCPIRVDLFVVGVSGRQRGAPHRDNPDGPAVGFAAIGRLEGDLAGYHAYHATRAELLRRLDRSQESRAAYDRAIELAGNTAETAYLVRRRDQLG
jgi:RNA polymerase sigma-70 factor, ECF subfamily